MGNLAKTVHKIVALTAAVFVFGLVVFGQTAGFKDIASDRAKKDLKKLCPYDTDALASRVLREYGSLFVANDTVAIPAACVYKDEAAVTSFQKKLETTTANIGVTQVTLQKEAMAALLSAQTEAAGKGLRITALDGVIAGSRSYSDTVRLWNSRFLPALNYWKRRGKITQSEADEALQLLPSEQVPLVMNWESQGMFFSTGFTRSIFSSVAPPGTSQHLSMLAFDVVQYGNPTIRSILNQNGWYQTVIGDEPHFTYLGYSESELPKRGLISITKNGYKFWVPAIP